MALPSGYEKDFDDLRLKVEGAQARMTEFNSQHPQSAALLELKRKL